MNSGVVLSVWLAQPPPGMWSIILVVGCVVVIALGEILPRLVVRRTAAARGITLGDSRTLDRARHVDAVLLDAHDTVTDGELEVVAVSPVEPDHDRNLRWFAGALCHAYPHPVGRAVAKLAGRGRLSDVELLGDVGVSGSVDRHVIRVGRPEWLEVETPEGIGTHIGVEVDARPMGHISVAPVVRPEAGDGVRRLADLGIEPLLVTDLPTRDTDRIADAANIATRWAETAPEKRGRLVTELREHGKNVAMVGPRATQPDAHHEADLSIGDDGASDIRMEDFNIALVVDALTLPRSLHSVLRVNRVIMLAIAVLLLGLAVSGALTWPWAAAALGLAAVVMAAQAIRARTGLAPYPPPVADEEDS